MNKSLIIKLIISIVLLGIISICILGYAYKVKKMETLVESKRQSTINVIHNIAKHEIHNYTVADINNDSINNVIVNNISKRIASANISLVNINLTADGLLVEYMSIGIVFNNPINQIDRHLFDIYDLKPKLCQ